MNALVILFTNLVFLAIYSNIFMVITPLAAAEAGVSEAVIGLLGALTPFIPIVIDIPLAGLIDRFGRRKIYRTGVILGCIATFIPTFFPNATGILIGYLVYKISGTIYSLPLLTMISVVPVKLTQAKVQGLNGFLQGLSAIAGSLLAGVLKDHFGSHVIYTSLLFFTILGLILSFFVPESASETDQHEHAGFIQTFKNAAALLRENDNLQKAAILETVNCFVIYGVYTSYFGLLVTNNLGFSASFLGVLLSIRILLSTAANLLYPRIAERFGKFLPPMFFFLLGSLIILMFPFSSSKIMITILVILLGIFGGLSPAAPNTLISEGSSSQNRQLGFATVSIGSGITGTLITVFLSWLTNYFSIPMVFHISGISGMVVILFVLLFLKKGKRS